MRFTNIIGQHKIKKKLDFFLDVYDKTNIFPNSILIAPKGTGKTSLAFEIARNLTKSDKSGKKPLIPINCASITSASRFWTDYYFRYIQGNECTIIFDECSELNKELSIQFLTLFNPNSKNENTLSLLDFDVTFSFNKHSFIFCTTESHKVLSPLMDRLERIELEEYKINDLCQIIKENVKANIRDEIVYSIASCIRCNPRKAVDISNKINSYLTSKSKKSFEDADWQVIKEKLGILDLGLSELEVRALRIIALKRNIKLTALAAKMGMSKAAMMHDIENYLKKFDLIEINENGRQITREGEVYLQNLKS